MPSALPQGVVLGCAGGPAKKALVKAIFWDNDGVLVDTERLYFRATQQVLATVGVSLTQAQYLHYFLMEGTGAWHLAAEKGISAPAIECLRQERNALYGALLSQQPLVIDGVRDVLDALHRKYTMGIVTSSRRDHFALIHQHTGFLKYFRFVLASGDYARSKPHPDPYLMALERSGLRPDECLVIEDSARGLAAAREAGIRCVVIPSDFTRGSDFTGAYKVLDTPSELLKHLERET